MKYNVGDKVIVLGLDNFKNPFHYKSCITEHTVLCATDKHWSPYRDYIDFSGSNLYSVFTQETGACLLNGNKMFHKTKDSKLIEAEIKNAIQKYDQYCNENDIREIQLLKNDIKASQDRIKVIEKGKGSWRLGFVNYGNKEYKEKVLKEMNKVLGS